MDAVGYSRLMAEDENGTLRILGTYRKTISDLIAGHGGRVFGTAGDSIIAEFQSAVEAVRCGVTVQQALQRHNADLPQGKRMEFRIGVNLGDVVVQGDDLLGDGVNVAARLQEVAIPNGICISGAVRDQIEGKLDLPIACIGERALKNIPRRIQVHKVDWQLDNVGATGVPAAAVTPTDLTLPDKPSIAVLPFTNMSGDPEQEYFADGLSEDIITALSRLRGFLVIARNSTFTYKGRATDIKQIGRELGVRYVLEGSVRRSKARLRITAQLIDAETNQHVWAEKYDRELADIFAVQDEITGSVVGTIEPQIYAAEHSRFRSRPPESLDAWGLVVRAMWHIIKITPSENALARSLLEDAVALAPSYAKAHSLLAFTWGREAMYLTTDASESVSRAEAAALRALACDENDAWSRWAYGIALFTRGRPQDAIQGYREALELNPNFALAYGYLCGALAFIGRSEEALAAGHQAIRMSPRDPFLPVILVYIAMAHFVSGRVETAADMARQLIQQRPNLLSAWRILMVCEAELGNLTAARATLAEVKRLQPNVSLELVRKTPFLQGFVGHDRVVSGFRNAGLE